MPISIDEFESHDPGGQRTNAERVLLFLAARGEGYPAEIARTFDTAPSMIKKQLERMERQDLP